jgi:hypothetical protein
MIALIIQGFQMMPPVQSIRNEMIQLMIESMMFFRADLRTVLSMPMMRMIPLHLRNFGSRPRRRKRNIILLRKKEKVRKHYRHLNEARSLNAVLKL